MRARLKKHYPRDHRNRARWVWVVRYVATDGTVQGNRLGYWTTDSRDRWEPRRYKGRTLPRLSESQARARMRRHDDLIEQGKQDKPDRTEWDQFIDEFVERNRGTVRDTTLGDYQAGMRVFGELSGVKSPRAVDRHTAKRFVQAAMESGRSHATVNKYLASLCRVWNSEFPSASNPFKATRTERKGGLRRLKVADRKWHRTTPEDLQALLGMCCDRWQAMILLAYTAALREAEVWNLTWDDVDLDAMTVAVNPKRDTDAIWLWVPKDYERRTLPLTPETKMALLRLGRVDGQPYVVLTPERFVRIQRQRGQGKHPNRVLNNFLRQYHTRCRWAEVPEDDFHALRKTAITNWLEAGVPPHEVQRMAGHSSVETTIRYYAKVDRAAIDRAREASVRYTRAVGHAG